MEQVGRSNAPAIYSWTLLDLLRKHKHPRHNAIGVEATIYGNAPRKAAGIEPHGTAWVAPSAVYYNSRNQQWMGDHTQPRDFLVAIRQGCIPAYTIRTARFDEGKARWVDGDLTRGWIPLLVDLLKEGHLRSHSEISHLIGQDSRELCPTRFRV